METKAHAIRLTIHAVAPMATVAINAKRRLVSGFTNLYIAALGLSVMSPPRFGGIESIIDKLVFLSKVANMF